MKKLKKIKKQTGQASLEVIVSVTVVLFVIGALFYYSSDLANDSIKANITNNSLNKLKHAITELSSFSPGSKKSISIKWPDNIVDSTIQENSIIITLKFASGLNDFVVFTDYNVFGVLPKQEGIYDIELITNDDGSITISYGFILLPKNINKTLFQGNDDNVLMTLKNDSDIDLNEVNCLVQGSIIDLISLEGVPNTIYKNSETTFNAIISIPEDYNSGTYNGSIKCSAEQDYSDSSNVKITVSIIDVTPPNAITNLSAIDKETDGEIYLEWNKSTAIDFDHYNVYYETTDFNNVNGLTVKKQINDIDLNYTTINGLTNDINYYFALTAVDHSGNELKDVNTVNAIPTKAIVSNNLFVFSWDSAELKKKELSKWTIGNKSDVNTITITRMKVRKWSENDDDNAKLIRIQLNNQQVWNGSQEDTNQWIDITDFIIPIDTNYSKQNTIRFDKTINDDGEQFQLEFEFSDGSTYTTTVYP